MAPHPSPQVSPRLDRLLPGAATPAQLEAIRLGCLDKGIDLELLFQQWRVSRLEALETGWAQQVQEWLESQ